MKPVYSGDAYELEVDDVVFYQGRERRIVEISNGFLILRTSIGRLSTAVHPAKVFYAFPEGHEGADR
ncbi:hypothetical protein [Glycomyces xiaoerkulensis]|uniref:hypothetical protein n=1 Tax=Glycomyces xiaoerkulensis TaxID=2038139 RepID=UPI000C25E598|nr:hypothetical protein [Glycomyces xiaoerkulensis]